MKRYVTNSRCLDPSLEEMERFAKSIMRKEGSSTVCNIVADAIEERYGIKSVDVVVFNGDGSLFNSSHKCNLSNDSRYVYDFTGDQFIGNSVTSKLWLYFKVDDSDIWVSYKGDVLLGLSQKYPCMEALMESNDPDFYGIMLK